MSNPRLPSFFDLVSAYIQVNHELQPCVVVYDAQSPRVLDAFNVQLIETMDAVVAIIPVLNEAEAIHTCESFDLNTDGYAEAWVDGERKASN